MDFVLKKKRVLFERQSPVELIKWETTVFKSISMMAQQVELQ